jgi:hypothetical protein
MLQIPYLQYVNMCRIRSVEPLSVVNVTGILSGQRATGVVNTLARKLIEIPGTAEMPLRAGTCAFRPKTRSWEKDEKLARKNENAAECREEVETKTIHLGQR